MRPDARKLLAEAAPLPWRSVRGHPPDAFASKGYRYVQFGPTEAKAQGLGTDQLFPADANLIVYAVNRLPAYEALVAAAETYITAEDEANRLADADNGEWLAACQAEKRESDNLRTAVRRLRDKVSS